MLKTYIFLLLLCQITKCEEDATPDDKQFDMNMEQIILEQAGGNALFLREFVTENGKPRGIGNRPGFNDSYCRNIEEEVIVHPKYADCIVLESQHENRSIVKLNAWSGFEIFKFSVNLKELKNIEVQLVYQNELTYLYFTEFRKCDNCLFNLTKNPALVGLRFHYLTEIKDLNTIGKEYLPKLYIRGNSRLKFSHKHDYSKIKALRKICNEEMCVIQKNEECHFKNTIKSSKEYSNCRYVYGDMHFNYRFQESNPGDMNFKIDGCFVFNRTGIQYLRPILRAFTTCDREHIFEKNKYMCTDQLEELKRHWEPNKLKIDADPIKVRCYHGECRGGFISENVQSRYSGCEVFRGDVYMSQESDFGELEEYETEDEEDRVEVEKEDDLDETISSVEDNLDSEQISEDYDFGLEQCVNEDVSSSDFFDSVEKDDSESDGGTYQTDSEVDANERNEEEEEEEEDDDDYNDDEMDENGRETNIVEREDMDHRLLALVTFFCKEGVSEKCMKRMLALMAVVYGEKAPFTINDIKKVVKNMGKNVIDDVSYYCSKCSKKKNFKEEKCAECKENRCEVLNRVTLIQCNVFWQLEEQLRSKGIEIIEGHRTIHYGGGGLAPEDIRNFPGYTSKMETKDEFEEGTVNLIFTVFSDGAVFKSLSRREVTPVLMRLEGINLESKSGGKNFVMISMVFADGGVKKDFADTFVEKSFCNLPKNVNVDVNGRTWTFRLKIMTFMSDMKERKMLTRLPNWHQIMGCSECLTEGRKKRSGTVSFNNFNKFSHRTDHTIMRDSSEGINGFNGSKVPAIFKFFPPKSFCLDPFHILGCGISKHLVAEILKPHQWVNLKMKPGAVEAIVDCIDSILPYTYDTVPLVSMRKSSKSTGREMEKKAIVMSGLVWEEACCTSNDYNVLMCGLFYSFMCQGNVMCDTTSLNKLLSKVYQLHATLEPDSVTIKYHSFYNHISSHELQYGRKHTSEVYEREHKNLMKSVNHQSTNCEQSIIIRYVCAQKCESLLLDEAKELACKQDILEALKENKERLPILNSQTNIIHIQCLIPIHVETVRHLNLGNDVKFLKRCRVSSSFGNFVFSASSYCGAKTTVSNLICYTDPLTKSLTFGQVEMIVDSGTYTRFIVKEFIIEPMTEIMKAVRRQGISRIAYEVLKLCQSLPPFIGKVTDQIQSIVPLENVMCPAMKLEIHDATYVLMSK